MEEPAAQLVTVQLLLVPHQQHRLRPGARRPAGRLHHGRRRRRTSGPTSTTATSGCVLPVAEEDTAQPEEVCVVARSQGRRGVVGETLFCGSKALAIHQPLTRTERLRATSLDSAWRPDRRAARTGWGAEVRVAPLCAAMNCRLPQPARLRASPGWCTISPRGGTSFCRWCRAVLDPPESDPATGMDFSLEKRISTIASCSLSAHRTISPGVRLPATDGCRRGFGGEQEEVKFISDCARARETEGKATVGGAGWSLGRPTRGKIGRDRWWKAIMLLNKMNQCG